MPDATRSARSLPALTAACLVLCLALLAAILWLNGGELVYSLDDPYIHLTLARNLLQGHYGLNPGECASPSSSLLFPFLLTIPLALGAGTWSPLLLNIPCLLLTALLLQRLFLRHVFDGVGGLGDFDGSDGFDNFGGVGEVGDIGGFDGVGDNDGIGEVGGAGCVNGVGDVGSIGRIACIDGEARSSERAAWLAFLTLLLFNGFGVAFTGMEHSLHVLLSVAFCLGLLELGERGREPWWFVPLLILEPLVRYEGLAVLAAGLLALALERRTRSALAAGLPALGLLAASMLAFRAMDLPPLPSSVLVKSAQARLAVEGGPAGAAGLLARQLREFGSSRAGLLLTLLGAPPLLALARPRTWTRTRARTRARTRTWSRTWTRTWARTWARTWTPVRTTVRPPAWMDAANKLDGPDLSGARDASKTSDAPGKLGAPGASQTPATRGQSGAPAASRTRAALDMSDASHAPQTPDASGMPGAPGAPQTPAARDMPGAQDMSGARAASKTSDAPGEFGASDASKIPSAPRESNAPGAPQTPEASGQSRARAASRRPCRRRVTALAGLALLALHALFGRNGWFGRYELYAVFILVGLAAALERERLRALFAEPRRVRAAALGLGLAVCFVYVFGNTLLTPLAARNIHRQQFQMGRFARAFGEPVAVNDLGLVGWFCPAYVLDLAGLGSEEARRVARVADPKRRIELARELAARRGARYAMLYESRFKDRIPPEWTKVAELRQDGPVLTPADRVVAFYATSPEFRDRLVEALRDFRSELPRGAWIDILGEGGGSL